jgi:hypothetical protein
MDNQKKKHKKNQRDEINFKIFFRIIGKRKWLFITTVIVVLIIGLIYTFIQTEYCEVSYRISIEENYPNSDLNKKYPDLYLKINYFNSDNLTSVFKSTDVFISLEDIFPEVDYVKLLNSDDVKIEQIRGEDIFYIFVKNADCKVADKIAMILINSLDNYIIDENKKSLENIITQIDSEIEAYEMKNQNLEEDIFILKEEIDLLYTKLYDFIVDYNIGLKAELSKRSKANYTYNNIVIPPNKILDNIFYINEEINKYGEKIIDNKNNQNNLVSLKEKLNNDEILITDRIDILSEEPVFTTENRTVRNIIFTVILSIIAGILVASIANVYLYIKSKKL